MKEIITALTTGSIWERLLTFMFLVLSFAVLYLFIASFFKNKIKGSIGPFSFEKEKDKEEKNSCKEKKDKKKPITEHPIFILIPELEHEITKLDDGSLKSAICINFLKECKFKAIKKYTYLFVKELDETDGANLCKFIDMLNATIDEYNTKSLNLKTIYKNKVITGVPECWKLKFAKWHDPHIHILMSQVKGYLTSNYYHNWWIAATSCLDALAWTLKLTIQDATLSLIDLNGELNKEIERMGCKDER